jgi:hypothetical protein
MSEANQIQLSPKHDKIIIFYIFLFHKNMHSTVYQSGAMHFTSTEFLINRICQHRRPDFNYIITPLKITLS